MTMNTYREASGTTTRSRYYQPTSDRQPSNSRKGSLNRPLDRTPSLSLNQQPASHQHLRPSVADSDQLPQRVQVTVHRQTSVPRQPLYHHPSPDRTMMLHDVHGTSDRQRQRRRIRNLIDSSSDRWYPTELMFGESSSAYAEYHQRQIQMDSLFPERYEGMTQHRPHQRRRHPIGTVVVSGDGNASTTAARHRPAQPVGTSCGRYIIKAFDSMNDSRGIDEDTVTMTSPYDWQFVGDNGDVKVDFNGKMKQLDLKPPSEIWSEMKIGRTLRQLQTERTGGTGSRQRRSMIDVHLPNYTMTLNGTMIIKYTPPSDGLDRTRDMKEQPSATDNSSTNVTRRKSESLASTSTTMKTAAALSQEPLNEHLTRVNNDTTSSTTGSVVGPRRRSVQPLTIPKPRSVRVD